MTYETNIDLPSDEYEQWQEWLDEGHEDAENGGVIAMKEAEIEHSNYEGDPYRHTVLLMQGAPTPYMKMILENPEGTIIEVSEAFESLDDGHTFEHEGEMYYVEIRKLITTVTHHTGRELPIYPGTYDYSGWGTGTFYMDGEVIQSISPSEARKKAKEAGLPYRKVDPLSGYSGTYLGD